jgi:hypothetical protein
MCRSIAPVEKIALSIQNDGFTYDARRTACARSRQRDDGDSSSTPLSALLLLPKRGEGCRWGCDVNTRSASDCAFKRSRKM